MQKLTDVVIETKESATEFCRGQVMLYSESMRRHTLVTFHDNPDLGAHAFIDQLYSKV